MSIDNEKIKKALDHFENDEYVESKEILQKEISNYKNEWLKDKLDLKNDLEQKSEE